MDINNLQKIQDNHYGISWKADGTRYLMYIQSEKFVYMIDRDNNVFEIPSLKFPQPPTEGTNDIKYIYDTLVDGVARILSSTNSH